MAAAWAALLGALSTHASGQPVVLSGDTACPAGPRVRSVDIDRLQFKDQTPAFLHPRRHR